MSVDFYRIIVFIGFFIFLLFTAGFVFSLFDSIKIKRENNTKVSKDRQIELILGKKNARVYLRNGRVSVNKQDIKYSSLKYRYKLSWDLARMEPNKNYNRIICSKDVIDESKQTGLNIRKKCKDDYGIDIHLEIYGSPSYKNPV